MPSGLPQVTITTYAGLGHAPRFGERHAGVSGELKRIESGDQVEAVVGEGQAFELADVKVAVRYPLPGDGQQIAGCVQPRHASAAFGGDLRGHPGPASHVEIRRAGAQPDALENRQVHRAAPSFLNVRPVARPRAPWTGIDSGGPRPCLAVHCVLLVEQHVLHEWRQPCCPRPSRQPATVIARRRG
jgi:hypothetical protein